MPTRAQSFPGKVGKQLPSTSVKEVTKLLGGTRAIPRITLLHRHTSAAQRSSGSNPVNSVSRITYLYSAGLDVNTPRLRIRMICASVVTHQIRPWIPHECIYRHIHMHAQKGSTFLAQKTLRIRLTGDWEGTRGSLVLFTS